MHIPIHDPLRRVRLIGLSHYDLIDKEITYVNHDFRFRVDGGYPSPFVLLGHEIEHAFRDNANELFPYNERGRLNAERNAVGFENYLRLVYGLSPLRNRYSNLIGGDANSFNTPRYDNRGEKISNFRMLNEKKEYTVWGFSYDISFYNRKATTVYMIVGMDENNHLFLKKYSSSAEYYKEIERWK